MSRYKLEDFATSASVLPEVDDGMTRAEDQTIGELPPEARGRLSDYDLAMRRHRARAMADAMTYFVAGSPA